jgi:hypothetical protein
LRARRGHLRIPHLPIDTRKSPKPARKLNVRSFLFENWQSPEICIYII